MPRRGILAPPKEHGPSIREEQIMVRYFYAWIPVAALGTLVILSLPWLGLIALIVVMPLVLGALGAFAWAVVAVPYRLVRAIGHRWHDAQTNATGLAATWRTQDVRRDRPTLADINHLTVLEARSLAEPITHISWEGAKR
jgi:hypothetical protein